MFIEKEESSEEDTDEESEDYIDYESISKQPLSLVNQKIKFPFCFKCQELF